MNFSAHLAQFSRFSDTVALRANSQRAPLTRASFYGLADDDEEEDDSGSTLDSILGTVNKIVTTGAGVYATVTGAGKPAPTPRPTPTARASMSSSNMLMIGAAGVAVVAAFVLLGKKHR